MKNKIFEANPQLDCYFETTDGECFFTENAAKDHARSLTEKAVTPYHKSNYVVVDSVEENNEVVGSVEETDEATEPITPVEEIEVTAEVVEPTAPVEPITPVEEIEVTAEVVEPVAPVEEKATQGKAKPVKK